MGPKAPALPREPGVPRMPVSPGSPLKPGGPIDPGGPGGPTVGTTLLTQSVSLALTLLTSCLTSSTWKHCAEVRRDAPALMSRLPAPVA